MVLPGSTGLHAAEIDKLYHTLEGLQVLGSPETTRVIPVQFADDPKDK